MNFSIRPVCHVIRGSKEILVSQRRDVMLRSKICCPGSAHFCPDFVPTLIPERFSTYVLLRTFSRNHLIETLKSNVSFWQKNFCFRKSSIWRFSGFFDLGWLSYRNDLSNNSSLLQRKRDQLSRAHHSRCSRFSGAVSPRETNCLSRSPSKTPSNSPRKINLF